MLVSISEVAEEIGWHLHGRQWVWGVCERDGCAVCDAAHAWVLRQASPNSMEEQLRLALLRRRAVSPAPKPMSAKERKADAKKRQRSLF